ANGGMMQGLGRSLLRSAPVAALCALTASAAGLMPGVAAAHSHAVPNGPASPNPVTGTPALAPTGPVEQVRPVVACNGVMYAVGSFTQISGFNGTSRQTFTRNNVFSFSQSAPYTITSWTPSTNGVVNSIQLTSDCKHAFIGGKFTQVDGSPADNIADIRTY